MHNGKWRMSLLPLFIFVLLIIQRFLNSLATTNCELGEIIIGFTFLGSKIHRNRNCSNEIKRFLPFGRL